MKIKISLTESKDKPIIMIPAKILSSVTGEYRTEPHWINFRDRTHSQQVDWAKKHFDSGIREPVDVTVFGDGTFGFGNGHHRVKAAQLLDEQIPIRIVRNKLLERSEELWNWWKDLVLAQGKIPETLNPEGWNLYDLEQAKEILQNEN